MTQKLNEQKYTKKFAIIDKNGIKFVLKLETYLITLTIRYLTQKCLKVVTPRAPVGPQVIFRSAKLFIYLWCTVGKKECPGLDAYTSRKAPLRRLKSFHPQNFPDVPHTFLNLRPQNKQPIKKCCQSSLQFIHIQVF